MKLLLEGGVAAASCSDPLASLRLSALAEHLFRILFVSIGVPPERSLTSGVCSSPVEEDIMRKFGLIIAAVGALAIAIPSIAGAQTVVIKRGGHHDGWHGSHARMHHDHGRHHGWRHRHHRGDKVVIIKKQRHYHR
jgi:hypothetical protein